MSSFGFVTSLRDHLCAKVSAAAQADFRKKLSEDLADHASFAHRLCKPSPPPPPNPCEQLDNLGTSADKWEKVWMGKLDSPPALPSVPTSASPLPCTFLDDVFQDTSVSLYRKACHSYPGKKATGPNLWEI